MNDINPRDNWRAYWRIIFDVIQGVPRLQQEISIWPINGLTRLAYNIKELAPSFIGNVVIDQDGVIFDDGFIECDINLEADISALANAKGLGKGPLNNLSEAIKGSNIFIRADVALADEGDREEYPLFHYPQPASTGVHLLEVYDANTQKRNVKWAISNQHYLTQNQFELETFNARHGLSARQDLLERKIIFEILADAIPIEDRITIPDHAFDPAPQTFFIGKTPNHPEGLKGTLFHLEFDPNNSCGSCPRPTIAGAEDWQPG